jgi:DNA-binding PadR family transcriptional regulator
VPRKRPITELEGTVLGLISARQPVTPYQVRTVFLRSPSPHWSGSAGAIYPLMRRLEKAGLLSSLKARTGSRPCRRYRVTAGGRRALRRWIGPPIHDMVVGVPADPLRMRVACSSLLPPRDRRAFLRITVARMRQQLTVAERGLSAEETGGFHFQLMARGAVAMMRARLEWIEEVSRVLGARRSIKSRTT